MTGQDAASDDRLLADAVMMLSEEARWEAYDLVSRRGVAAAVDLLRGHSGELALSWSGRDHLFGTALDQAAAALAQGAAIPQVDLSAYLKPCLLPSAELAAVGARAAALPLDERGRLSRHVRETTNQGGGRRRGTRASDVLRELRQGAALNRRLWSDARLGLGEHDRALMLAAADAFEDAARAVGHPKRRRGLLRALWPR